MAYRKFIIRYLPGGRGIESKEVPFSKEQWQALEKKISEQKKNKPKKK